MFVRTAGDAAAMALTVQRAAQSAAPDVPYVNVQSLGQLLDPQLRAWELGATMLSAFGVLAIVLSAIGLYSVVAYGATQRTRELGIRVALGAQRTDVARVLARDGMRVVALGLVAGLGLGVVLGHAVGDLLFQTSVRDPAVIGFAALVLAIVAAAASAVPALRASRPDLTVVLRGE
jgi:ABC-type antimicrobial peptide transport system permease subunit